MGQTHDNAGFDSTADAAADAGLTLDTDWRCTHMGAGAAEFLGCGTDELVGSVVWNAFPSGVGDSLRYSASIAMESQRPTTLQTRWDAQHPWVESTIRPSPHGVRISFADVTARHHVERMNEGHREVLTGIAAQHPLKDNLALIALLHEELNPGAICSILLLAPDGRTIAHGAAPNLPDSYNAAIHGVAIGADAGSCGTALWRRERIVVADIATDPLWIDYKDLALGHGLLACWSTPVFGSNGQSLGTFAVYYREVREPSAYELDCIDQMLTITTIAIESAQLIERVRQRDGFFDLSLEIYCVFDTKSQRIVQANPAFTRLTGFSEFELTSHPYTMFVHPDDLDGAAGQWGHLPLPVQGWQLSLALLGIRRRPRRQGVRGRAGRHRPPPGRGRPRPRGQP
ncbi:MAG TPA: GAF domain-containing protein [Dokdonella sp.]|nr:GAF domain-containing protein [Dokdonella sp.]